MKPGRRPPGGFGVAFVPDVCFLAHLWFPVSAARFVFAKSAGKPHNPRVSAAKKKDSGLPALLSRHAAAFGYVLREVLPVILRTAAAGDFFPAHRHGRHHLHHSCRAGIDEAASGRDVHLQLPRGFCRRAPAGRHRRPHNLTDGNRRGGPLVSVPAGGILSFHPRG